MDLERFTCDPTGRTEHSCGAIQPKQPKVVPGGRRLIWRSSNPFTGL